MRLSLVLATERKGLVLRQLAMPSDDVAYFEAQNESPEHIAAFDNTVYRFVGKASIHPHEHDEMEIGYWLRPSAMGKGYATIAVKTLTAYLKPASSRIFAEVRIDNESSIKVMKRSGYHQVAIVDKDWGRAIVFEPRTKMD